MVEPAGERTRQPDRRKGIPTSLDFHAGSESSRGEVTRLLDALRQGDPTAQAKLIPLVYEELRRAVHYMRQARPDHTQQATVLVHEAYLRLVDQRAIPQNRIHFLAVAAHLMRRMLVDHARARLLRSARRPSSGYHWTMPRSSPKTSWMN